MIKIKQFIAASAIVCSAPLSAAPVVWTFTDVLFEDGGTVTGNFTYNANTNIYSDINITTPAGSQITTEFLYGDEHIDNNEIGRASCRARV